MRTFAVSLLILAFFLVGCGTNDPVPPANTGPSQPNAGPAPGSDVNAPGASTAKGTALPFNASNGTVTFMHYLDDKREQGGFTMVAGTIDLVNDNPEESSITLEVETNTLFADDQKAAEKLRSADFFDVANHPKAAFRSTKITAGAKPAPNNFTIAGDLEIRGKTVPVTLPARIDISEGIVSINAGIRVNSEDFGMKKEGTGNGRYPKNLAFTFDTKARRR
ncbi:MAG: YceI family protein [Chloracidobacterium sp.]|nr:YceI family protein [Chloracidobacterium sp.]